MRQVGVVILAALAGTACLTPLPKANAQLPGAARGWAPIGPNVGAGFAVSHPNFPTTMIVPSGIGPMGITPSVSPGGILLPASAGSSGPGQGLGLTAAYSLTADKLADRSAGQSLGTELGAAAVEYQRKVDEYTTQELRNTLRVINSRMLEPEVFIRIRVVQVNRSHFTDVGSVLSYVANNPKTAPITYSGKPQNVLYKGTFPADLTPFGGQGLTINITTKRLDDLITAIQHDFKSDLIAAPSVVAINDQQVNLFAGSNIPFFYGRATTLIQTQRMQDAIYKDVGIHLQVLPHIISRRELEMTFDVLPEGRALRARLNQDHDLDAYTADRIRMIEEALASRPIILSLGYRFGTPETMDATIKLTLNDDMTSAGTTATVQTEGNVRAGQTKVRLSNGTGMVIGGIISEAANTTASKVPVLGDIPVIGQAFSRKSKERDKIETLIFLEAAVVNPPGDSLVNGYEYADRHLPNGPPIGSSHPAFSQVTLAPLEGHNRIELTPTEVKQGIVKPVTTAVEILK